VVRAKDCSNKVIYFNFINLIKNDLHLDLIVSIICPSLTNDDE